MLKASERKIRRKNSKGRDDPLKEQNVALAQRDFVLPR